MQGPSPSLEDNCHKQNISEEITQTNIIATPPHLKREPYIDKLAKQIV